MEFYERILAKTQQQLKKIDELSAPSLTEINTAIQLAESGLEQLRERVEGIGFKNSTQECYFFKRVKPKAESFYIYYKELLYIEQKKPLVNEERQVKFYKKQLVEYEDYLQANFEFHLYYQQGLEIFDEQYFLRGKKDIQLYKGKTYYCQSSSFSTNRDGCLAIIIAYQRLIASIQNQLKTTTTETGIATNEQLTWTAKKVDLIELVYALHTAAVFNQGKADLKQIVQVVGHSFQIELGDVYRSFLEIRSRKINNTKFISHLKRVLEKRMYEADE